jgi:hypothetical protein
MKTILVVLKINYSKPFLYFSVMKKRLSSLTKTITTTTMVVVVFTMVPFSMFNRLRLYPMAILFQPSQLGETTMPHLIMPLPPPMDHPVNHPITHPVLPHPMVPQVSQPIMVLTMLTHQLTMLQNLTIVRFH